MSKNAVSAQARLFCWHLACCGNPTEAARQADYENPEEQAIKLLMRPEIRHECKRAATELKNLPSFALKGLERLAFGSSAGALHLLFCEENGKPENLNNLDLFCVSEIKRPKGGGLEIKFYDRQAALEALLAHGGAEESGVYSLYNSLEKSARNSESNAV